MSKTYYHSPLGWIELLRKEGILQSIGFSKKPKSGTMLETGKLRREFDAYFRGKRNAFSAPLETVGTVFQKKVWKVLRAIPQGKTLSYKEVGAKLGMKSGLQAIGQAVGCNPFMLITPCHRVIGSDGSLTGYAFGLEKKEWLLRHEGCLA